MWDNPQTGPTTIRIDIRSSIFAAQRFWVKIEMYADQAIDEVGVEDLVISSIIEHNKGAMAYLDKGSNNLSVTLDSFAIFKIFQIPALSSSVFLSFRASVVMICFYH